MGWMRRSLGLGCALALLPAGLHRQRRDVHRPGRTGRGDPGARAVVQLARGKSATASGQTNGNEASKAVDGRRSTGWQPAPGPGTQWLQVDLGRQIQLDGLRLHWGETYRLARQNLAGGASYTANPAPPGPRFLDASGREATDGVLADDWGDDLAFGYELSANGLKHVDAAVTVDLGRSQTIAQARAHVYQEYPYYRPNLVYAPKATGVFVDDIEVYQP